MTFIADATRSSSKEDHAYKLLCGLKKKDKKLESIPLYVQTTGEKVKRIVLSFLGSGGSKCAYELEGGSALLMSSEENFSYIANSIKWSEMVDEEITGTSRVRDLGLLACDLEKATVFMTNDSTIGVPAYITETFSQLSSKGIWIIDQKNPRSSTWKRSLFDKKEDSFDEGKWQKILNPFLKDIVKLLQNNFWLCGDNLNMAILEKSDEGDGVNYEVRYFGFDFSSKHDQLSFNKLKPEEIDNLVTSIIFDSISCLMSCEFDVKSDDEQRSILNANLRKKCISQVLSEIKQ